MSGAISKILFLATKIFSCPIVEFKAKSWRLILLTETESKSIKVGIEPEEREEMRLE